MGLSTKQVSNDGFDWNQTLLQDRHLHHQQTLEIPKFRLPMKRQLQQQQDQPPEPLKCPRCDSTNTKFCYYNNYNKSQPRHFCKACKRHWTKGGTLRNVPVGGGRKNKRPKPSNASAPCRSLTNNAATSAVTGAPVHQAHKLYQTLNFPPTSLSCTGSLDDKAFPSSSLALPQDLNFQFTSSLQNSSPFCSSSSTPSPFSLYSSRVLDAQEYKPLEEYSTVTSIMPISTLCNNVGTHSWLLSNSGAEMTTNGTSSHWDWDDIDKLVSTNMSLPNWDDVEIKPL